MCPCIRFLHSFSIETLRSSYTVLYFKHYVVFRWTFPRFGIPYSLTRPELDHLHLHSQRSIITDCTSSASSNHDCALKSTVCHCLYNDRSNAHSTASSWGNSPNHHQWLRHHDSDPKFSLPVQSNCSSHHRANHSSRISQYLCASDKFRDCLNSICSLIFGRCRRIDCSCHLICSR